MITCKQCGTQLYDYDIISRNYIHEDYNGIAYRCSNCAVIQKGE